LMTKKGLERAGVIDYILDWTDLCDPIHDDEIIARGDTPARLERVSR